LGRFAVVAKWKLVIFAVVAKWKLGRFAAFEK
jgi:hypothetical protein